MAVVLITGCSSGFGLLTALELARRGDRVFATMRDTASDTELKTRAENERLEIDISRLDVRDAKSVHRAVADVYAKAGRIDALVNNAGVGRLGPVEEFEDGEIHELFDTNVYGVVRVTREVLPIMRTQGAGVIVNVGSVIGLTSAPFFGAYSASKFALEAITEALGPELASFGIRVISVCPGPYNTPAGRKAVAPLARHGPDSPYKSQWEVLFTEKLPAMSASGEPEEVAAVIADAIHDPQTPSRVVVPPGADKLWVDRVEAIKRN